MKWQPIETAPKNGEHIFALCLEDFPQVVYWHSVVDYEEEGLSQIWKSSVTDRFVIPTHWMHLPPPPKGE